MCNSSVAAMLAHGNRHPPRRARHLPRGTVERDHRSRHARAHGSATRWTSTSGRAARAWSSTSGVTRHVTVDTVEPGRGWSFEWSVDDEPASHVSASRSRIDRRRWQPADDHRDAERRHRRTLTRAASAGICARCCCGRARWQPPWCGERARRSVRGTVRSDATGAVRTPDAATGPTRPRRLAAAHHAHPPGGREASPGAGRRRPRQLRARRARGALHSDPGTVGDRRDMAHRVEPRMGPHRPDCLRCRVGLRPTDVGDHMGRWTTSR